MKKNVPQWFAKGNIYQINPRTFSPEGDLKSIGKELPFLRELGICAIYLCPIFKEDDSITNWSKRQIASQTNNPKNPYRMNDYFAHSATRYTMHHRCMKATYPETLNHIPIASMPRSMTII